ncbi:MAG: glycine betaine ABC transporter substrate-binding protein [Dermatophilaceae bacterium]|nr:glycine betaine ABC transporter substrate-binding protein [Dermatophilaceae bacterium]
MRTNLNRLLPLTAVLAVAGVAVSGCTVSKESVGEGVKAGSIQKVDALKDAPIKVGSKDFDEQLLLGQIAMVALEAAGAKPVDKTNIQGSNNTRLALTGGAVDLYWEYTGTGWISYLKQTKPIPDPQKQYDAVVAADAAKGVTWWDRAPANNTYALAQTKATLDKYGVKTLSDYAALAKKDPAAASMCLESEFQSRDDGFPGVEKTYGFKVPSASQHLLDTAVVYTELAKGGTCNFGEVFTTDGRVASLKLNVIEDDKKFFPNYNPALSVRSDIAKKYPGLEALFKPIADKLTTEKLLALNKEVSVDGKKPRAVAEAWMKSEGFTK